VPVVLAESQECECAINDSDLPLRGPPVGMLDHAEAEAVSHRAQHVGSHPSVSSGTSPCRRSVSTCRSSLPQMSKRRWVWVRVFLSARRSMRVLLLHEVVLVERQHV